MEEDPVIHRFAAVAVRPHDPVAPSGSDCILEPLVTILLGVTIRAGDVSPMFFNWRPQRSDALRDSPVVDGCRWLSVAEAVSLLREHWLALGVVGRCGLNGGTSGASITSLGNV